MSRDRAQALLCHHFGPFGSLNFPYISMGKIDSLHLFGDTELMIFALYWHNRNRWKQALDIGANLGLHSICMAKLGWTVHAYEPDFEHYQRLIENLRANHVATNVKAHMVAVHTSDGDARFVRVLNNLTGNHLEGYKNSYGPRETVIVPIVDCRKLWEWANFAKIDCEGNEAELCDTLTKDRMRRLDLVLEVRNTENARRLFDHFSGIEAPMWAQKINWERVRSFEQMPKHNREGTLFVGQREPWI